MKIRYILLTAVAVISLFSALGLHPVSAQTDKEPAAFKNVRLWVYPEYDDPRLLVMMEGQIVGADAPATVRFLVPTSAEMYSAGSMNAQGQYSGGPPNRKASQIAGWDEISYELKTNTFRVEYYDAAIKGQPDKKISYDFRRLYPINDLRVIIQEPRSSTNYAVSPQGGVTGSDSGLVTHTYDYQNLDAPSPIHFDISYTRSDPKPSLSSTPAAGATDIGAVVGVIVIVGLLTVAGLAWVLKSRLKRRPARAPAKVQAAQVSHSRKTGKRFCTQCGSEVDAQARFCPRCGAKRRGQA